MFLHTLEQAIVITGFVFVMMLIIEYVNVQTHGSWQQKLAGSKWQQYIFAAFFGIIPGCLGAYTVVTMYSHGLLSFGAIVATMIATSGDEAFLLYATVPKTAIIITALLFIIGIIAGIIIDKLIDSKKMIFSPIKNKLPLHSEDDHDSIGIKKMPAKLKRPSLNRMILISILIILLYLIITGTIAGDEERWIRASLIFVAFVSLFIVLTVPEHFIKEHLWGHIAKIHTPRIFLWVFGTLLIFNILLKLVNVESLITENLFLVLVIAVLIGIIPESGPHFIFITLFVQGVIPFSILLASSISQDGHGMIPLLAESKRSFISIKAVNVIVALLVGIIAYLFGI